MSAETYVDPSRVRVWKMPGGTSRAEIEGERSVLRAQFRRLFPLSKPHEYIVLQDGDRREVAILRTLDGMADPSRTIVEEELQRRYFTPKISRIIKLVLEAGMWRFETDTDRGLSTFYVRNWRDSAHEIGAGRWLVNSVDGQRYEIPSTDTLDVHSQNLLEQLL